MRIKNFNYSLTFWLGTLPFLLLISCDRGNSYEARKSVENLSSKTFLVRALKRGELEKEQILKPNEIWIPFQYFEEEAKNSDNFFSGFENSDSILVIDHTSRDTLITYYYPGLNPQLKNPDHNIYDKEDHLHEVQEPNKRGEVGYYIYRFIIEDKHFDEK